MSVEAGRTPTKPSLKPRFEAATRSSEVRREKREKRRIDGRRGGFHEEVDPVNGVCGDTGPRPARRTHVSVRESASYAGAAKGRGDWIRLAIDLGPPGARRLLDSPLIGGGVGDPRRYSEVDEARVEDE